MGRKKVTVIDPNVGRTYESSSTIDNPPREEPEAAEPSTDEGGQVEIPGTESVKTVRQSREVKFKAQLKADDYVIPIASGEVPADMVEESLVKGLGSQRFRSVLREVVGLPLNAGLLDCESDAQRAVTLDAIAECYRRAVDAIIRLIPRYPDNVGPAELKAIFEDMKKRAEKEINLALELRTGFKTPESPTLAQEARSVDEEGDDTDQGDRF